jgi:hypothetical protein
MVVRLSFIGREKENLKLNWTLTPVKKNLLAKKNKKSKT